LATLYSAVAQQSLQSRTESVNVTFKVYSIPDVLASPATLPPDTAAGILYPENYNSLSSKRTERNGKEHLSLGDKNCKNYTTMCSMDVTLTKKVFLNLVLLTITFGK